MHRLIDILLAFAQDHAVNAILTLVGTVVSLVMMFPALRGLILTRQGNDQTRDIVNQTQGILKQTQEIVESLTTHFEGDFPKYLEKIVEIIPKAKSRLLVLAVIPTHGAYSKTKTWLKIQDAIEDKMREQERVNRELNNTQFEAILVYGCPEVRRENYDRSYSRFGKSSEDWPAWIKDNRPSLIEFLYLVDKNKKITRDIDGLSIADLKEIRIGHDQKALDEVYGKFTKFHSKETSPLFCWITDNEAVFSFKTEDPNGRYSGSGIYTRDPELIKTLIKTFEYFKARSIPDASV